VPLSSFLVLAARPFKKVWGSWALLFFLFFVFFGVFHYTAHKLSRGYRELTATGLCLLFSVPRCANLQKGVGVVGAAARGFFYCSIFHSTVHKPSRDSRDLTGAYFHFQFLAARPFKKVWGSWALLACHAFPFYWLLLFHCKTEQRIYGT